MNIKINNILNALNETPRLLKELISEISPQLYNQEIIKGKWSIHEHATHIGISDIYGFQDRLKKFKYEAKPIFKSFSGDSFDKNFFIKLDLQNTIADFFQIRQDTIALAKSLSSSDWSKSAVHPEYKIYTPYIMLRHMLLHDHSHLYKIEDMGFRIGHTK